MAYNYALAFLEFCKGTETSDISHILGIPEDVLANKMALERWPVLRDTLPAVLPDVVVAPQGKEKFEAQAQVLQENREENYRLWCLLRSDAARVITDLVEGRLRFKRYWHNRGAIIEKEVEPTMADRNALANYLQIIANGSYLALGDRGATDSRSGGDIGAAATQAPAITIVMPGAVSLPREHRQEIQLTNQVKVETAKTVVDAEVVG
jgi:hypothetical protein